MDYKHTRKAKKKVILRRPARKVIIRVSDDIEDFFVEIGLFYCANIFIHNLSTFFFAIRWRRNSVFYSNVK